MRYILFSLCLILCSVKLNAQSGRFYAQLDAKEIVLGSYVDVQFILENEDGRNFKPPSFKDFDILSGPNRSSSMRVVNGSMSKKLSYSYSLSPKKTGNFIIGAASIESSSGKKYTEAQRIKVIKAVPSNKNDYEDVFIKTICSDTVSYVGQQITLSYKLYTKLDVRSVNVLSEPDFEGFYTEMLSTGQEPTTREIINGQEYATKIIRRYSLFPQQKSYYTIQPISINLGIATSKNSRSFLFSSQLKQKRVITDSINLEVKNTPYTDIKSFSGAIGRYNMDAVVAKRSITTDDAITITLQVTGDGDSKTVGPPMWLSSDSLDIYDPNVLEDEVFTRSNKLIHRKTFEYLIVPRFPGKYLIDPEFTYFNPDSQKYIQIHKTLPPVNVIPGNSFSSISSTNHNSVNNDIFPNTSLSKSSGKIHGTFLHNVYLILFVLSIITLFSYNIYLRKSGQKDPLEIKRKKALEKAKLRLEKLSMLINSENNPTFYEELSRSVKQFIQDKYNIQAFHINTSECIEKLKSTPLTKEQIDSFEEIMNASETALYAPGFMQNKQEIYRKTLNLFTMIES